MSDTKFKLADKEYKLKNFLYNPDRINQIKFNRKYLDFEKDNIGEELCNQHYNNTHKIILIQKLTEELNKDMSDELKVELKNQLVSELLSEDVTNEFYRRQAEAIQLFFFENESNSRTLCDMLLENSLDINHNPLTETEFLEYNSFILELFNYFFFSKKS